MKKVIPKIVPKTWGREIWLWSPLASAPTFLDDGSVSKGGPLIKILIADEPLPVQVHPDDAKAMELEGQPLGKSESWYVLNTFKPNAGFVIGLKDYSPTAIKRLLKKNKFEENLVWTPALPGRFYYCPAGMVHAMGGGIEALEVQQPSDITYRYYDFNRIVDGKPRTMQVDKAIMSQKENVSQAMSPSSKNPLTYDTFYAKQFFPKEPMVAPSTGVAVDLKNRIAYLVMPGEKINFDHYSFIQFGNEE